MVKYNVSNQECPFVANIKKLVNSEISGKELLDIYNSSTLEIRNRLPKLDKINELLSESSIIITKRKTTITNNGKRELVTLYKPESIVSELEPIDKDQDQPCN
nr:hypothetical protein 6 [bacterium]